MVEKRHVYLRHWISRKKPKCYNSILIGNLFLLSSFAPHFLYPILSQPVDLSGFFFTYPYPTYPYPYTFFRDRCTRRSFIGKFSKQKENDRLANRRGLTRIMVLWRYFLELTCLGRQYSREGRRRFSRRFIIVSVDGAKVNNQ